MGMGVEFLALRGHGNKAISLDLLLKEVVDKTLVDNRAPEFFGVVAADAEVLQGIVLVGLDNGVGYTGQDVGQMLYLEFLGQALDQLDDELHFLTPVKNLSRVDAVVAAAAVVLIIIFSEITEQQASAALARLRVGDYFRQQLTADFLLGNWLSLHELLQLLYVFVAVVCDAASFLAVGKEVSIELNYLDNGEFTVSGTIEKVSRIGAASASSDSEESVYSVWIRPASTDRLYYGLHAVVTVSDATAKTVPEAPASEE